MTRGIRSIRRAVALGAAAFAVWSVPVLAQGWMANADDALLLELHTRSYKVGDTIRGYQTPQGVCVDFADLIQTLDLPVRLDKKSRRATGWLFAEDQRLTIDRDSNTVQTVNGRVPIPAGAIHDTPEGWCMDLDALSTWMGVRLKPDLSNLAIKLETDKKLPFLEAIERKQNSRGATSKARRQPLQPRQPAQGRRALPDLAHALGRCPGPGPLEQPRRCHGAV
jgi:hypothetical protein